MSDDPGSAVVSRPEVLERLDLTTGAVTTLHRPAGLAAPALSPNGQWVAMVSTGATTYRAEALLVFDMRTGTVRARHEFDPSEDLVEVVWADDDNLAAANGTTLRFFDAGLRAVGTVANWQTQRLLAAGGRVFGTQYGGKPMQVATRESGTPAEFVRLPDGITRAIAVLPGDVPPVSTTTTPAPPTPAAPVSLPEAPAASDASSGRPWGAVGLVLVLVGVVAVALKSRAGSRSG